MARARRSWPHRAVCAASFAMDLSFLSAVRNVNLGHRCRDPPELAFGGRPVQPIPRFAFVGWLGDVAVLAEGPVLGGAVHDDALIAR
eukprot:9492744-Pyramimonas_sp.AAC.1